MLIEWVKIILQSAQYLSIRLMNVIFESDMQQGNMFSFVALRIYIALAIFQPYHDLEAGDNQSLKFKWRGQELIPGPLAPQANSLTTRPPPPPPTCFDNIQ